MSRVVKLKSVFIIFLKLVVQLNILKLALNRYLVFLYYVHRPIVRRLNLYNYYTPSVPRFSRYTSSSGSHALYLLLYHAVEPINFCSNTVHALSMTFHFNDFGDILVRGRKNSGCNTIIYCIYIVYYINTLILSV